MSEYQPIGAFITPWEFLKSGHEVLGVTLAEHRENKTGRYQVICGKLVKVSTEIPSVAFDSATCPQGGYWAENLGHGPVFVRDHRHKKQLLKDNNLQERG